MDAPQHKRRLRKKLEKVLGALEQQSSHEAQLQELVRDARSREQVLEKQHSSLHADYVALAARVQAQQEQLQQAQDTAAQLRLERESLQLQLTTAQQAASRQAQDQDAALAAHQREVETLRGDRDAAVSAHQAVLTCLCRAEEQVSTLASQLRQRDQECAQLRQAAAGQAAVATATGEAAAAVEEQLLALTQELGEARQQLAEQQLRHQEDVADMQALQAAAAEAVDLRHQLAEATSAAAALAAVRQQQEAALAKAAGDVAAAGEAANQLRSLVDALTAGDQDVMKQQLLDMSSRLQRSAPLLAAREASLSATQQQLERARGEVVAAQAAAAAARQRCEVLRGLNSRLQATVVQQEALLEACLPPDKRASLPGAASPQWLALSSLQQQAAQLQSLTSQLLASQPQHPGLQHTTSGMAATLQHAAGDLEQHIRCLLSPAGPSTAPAAGAYLEALEGSLEERCSEVEQLAGMVEEAQQQLQGHVGTWSQLLAALGDTHGGVAAAASCHRAVGSTPGSPVHAQQDAWQQRVQTGDGEEGEGQLLLLPGSLGSSLARSSGALSLVLQELGEAPAGCLAGDESWLHLEATLRDQLGRLQLLLRSGASPAAAAAVGTGGTGEGAGLGAQLRALEVALAQQEKAVRAYVAKLSASASQLSSCLSTAKQVRGVLGACRPTTQQLRDNLSSGRSPYSTWRSSLAGGTSLGASLSSRLTGGSAVTTGGVPSGDTPTDSAASTMWMGGLSSLLSTANSGGATSSSNTGALMELVGELRLEVVTLQALLARKEEEVEGLAARQRRLLSGTEELVPVATLQHCQRQLKQAQQEAASAAQQLVRVRGAALGALDAYVTRVGRQQRDAAVRLRLAGGRKAGAAAQASKLAQELLDTQGCLAASWQRHLGRSAAALSLLGRVADRGEAVRARHVLLAWQRRVVQQTAVVNAWGQLACAASAAQLAVNQPPRCIAARLARRRRQDADWSAAARTCRLPSAVFTAWRAATRLSRGQAEVEQASAQLEALSAALPAWVAHLGDARRLERAWLAWRLAAAAATARAAAAAQLSRSSSRTQQGQGQPLDSAVLQAGQPGVGEQVQGPPPAAAEVPGAGEAVGAAGMEPQCVAAPGDDQAAAMQSGATGVFANAALTGGQQQPGGVVQPVPGSRTPQPPKHSAPHHPLQQQQQVVLGAGGKWSLRRASRGQAAAGGTGGSLATPAAQEPGAAVTSKELFPPQPPQVLQDASRASAAAAAAVARGTGQFGVPSLAVPAVPGALSLLQPGDSTLMAPSDLTTAVSSSPRRTAQLAGNLAAITSSLAALQQQVAAHRQVVCRSPGGTLGRQQEQPLLLLEQQERPPWVDVGSVEVSGVGLADGEQLQEGEPGALTAEASGVVGEVRSAVWYAESPRHAAAAAAAAAGGMQEDLGTGEGGSSAIPPTLPAPGASDAAAAAPGEADEVLGGDSSARGQGSSAAAADPAATPPRKGSMPAAGKGTARPKHPSAAGATDKGPLSREPSKTLSRQSSQQGVAGSSRPRGMVGKRASAGGVTAGPGRSPAGKASGPPQQPRQQQQQTTSRPTLAATAAAAAASGRLRSSGHVGDPEQPVSFPLTQPPGSPAQLVVPPLQGGSAPVAAGSPGPAFLRPAAAGSLGAQAGSVLLHQRADVSSSGTGLGSGVPAAGSKAGQLQGRVTAAAASNPLTKAGWQLLGQPVMVKVDGSGGMGGGSVLTGTIGSSSSWRKSGALTSTSVLEYGQAEEPEVYIAQERPRSATPKPQAWAALPAPYVQQQ